MMESAFIYFGEVAKLGSIRQAAERLHVSASSISRQIAKLEHDFDAPLLIRHPQGVKLTSAGHILVHFIQRRSRELQRLQASIDDLKHLQRGHIILQTVEGTLGGILTKALAVFWKRHPSISYEVIVSGTDDVMRAVGEDRCDIGLSFHPYPRPDVVAVAEIRQPLLVVMAPNHPLAVSPQLRLNDLKGVPVSLPNGTFGIRHLVDSAVKQELVELSVRCETNSIDMLRQFAMHGMGVTFLPAFAFEREAASGTLVGVRLADASLATATAQICKHAELEPTSAAKRLLDVIIETSGATLVLR